MITKVTENDAAEIAAIYNYYIRESVATFDTEEWQTEKMEQRIITLSSSYPYIVYRTEDGKIAGFCYAHPWKEKDAYSRTLETTVYVSPEHTGRGIGQKLMEELIDICRKKGFMTLIACITEGNENSFRLHRKLGFKQVSHFKKVGMKFNRFLDVIDYELIL
ncbi:N-acetyltransferase [Bacteroides caecigallinarum]|jgi:phosphinothricin acetyltransferase|uniref:GNAT family N-acetyltransferase n=1 Tax=Bacteroides TaxID=816 RepID=UPI000822A51D|nr:MULTISPECIES: GNAT family N-acetyltransferase [Bacteroides]MBM6960205.1 N-acetyltransferase [Bacteroides caecigallinarum]MCF2736249.1 N-acetyltransferase [Bacteroides caecigallinarum]MCU6771747.1 GNAT family N-acetyltransferase [Bacteroides cellulolyticus]MDN0051928.1 N-acetyltransferase family protein [Bacteroides caecigallinarum]MDN0070759.1 N-acetyltransferase family protein [Bacteroides caecigallinarum]